MFETLIVPASAPSEGSLRPLDWNELVARFSAVHEMRALSGRTGGSGGSFADRAAACLHSHHNGERPVNLDALGSVKPLTAIPAGTVADGTGGDQGTQ